MTNQAATELRRKVGKATDRVGHARGPSTVAPPVTTPRIDLVPIAVRDLAPASPLWRDAVRARLLGVADATTVAVVLVASVVLLGKSNMAVAALAGLPLAFALFKLAGLYDRDELRLTPSTLDEAPRLLQLTALLALGTSALLPLLARGRFDGGEIALVWIALFAATTTGRVLARSIARRICPVERCLVVGDIAQADHIRETLAGSQARAIVVACLPLRGEDVNELGGPEIIRSLVRDLQVRRIIVAPPASETNADVDLIRVAKAVGVRVTVAPPMLEAVGSIVEFDDVNGTTMLGVRRFGLPRSTHLIKRAFDVVVTLAALLAVAPLLLAVALAIRLDSKGPIFFHQIRVGRDGRRFWMIKFRSMVANAEAQKESLRPFSEAGDGLFKVADDPRVTGVGRFLRRSSLDELPQLFNVLRGEMSLVGPRPLVVDEDDKVTGLDRSRLHFTPGMTGPWQVLDSRVSLEQMVAIDYRYVANWSLWLDVKILVRTVRHVARRGNL
jgi:exopolysaccharide biosynthesis polyprenyl glycosylphosphotransferase